jgi:hypothetical protein
MRAFLIDPTAKAVTRLDNDKDWPLTAIQQAIDTDAISRASLRPGQRGGDSVWVDDNGFLSAGAPVFFVGEYAMPLAGKGLVLGLDQIGENRGPEISLEELQAVVQFTNLVSAGKLTPMFETAGGFHMGLPICKPAPDWAPSDNAESAFTFELWGQIIRLEDIGDHTQFKTVTNDAEGVFRLLREAVGERMKWTPVIYRDTEGQWDAMLPNDEGGFRSFVVLGAKTYEEAAAKLDAMFGPDA